MPEPTPVDDVLEALQRIDTLLAAVAPEKAAEATQAMEQMVYSLHALFARPALLEVLESHREDAVALVSCYLDHSNRFELLAQTLTDLDTRGLGAPEYRLGLLAALTQLATDSLIMAVAVGLSHESTDVPDSSLRGACRSLLQRLALARSSGK